MTKTNAKLSWTEMTDRIKREVVEVVSDPSFYEWNVEAYMDSIEAFAKFANAAAAKACIKRFERLAVFRGAELTLSVERDGDGVDAYSVDIYISRPAGMEDLND